MNKRIKNIFISISFVFLSLAMFTACNNDKNELSDVVFEEKDISKIYDGDPIEVSKDKFNIESDGDFSIKFYKKTTVYEVLNDAPTLPGEYYYKVFITKTRNYRKYESDYIPFTISKLNASATLPQLSKVYDSNQVLLTKDMLNTSSDGEMTVYYYLENQDDSIGSLLPQAPTNPGNYFYKIQLSETDIYNEYKSNYIPFTIQQIPFTLNFPDLTKEYDGTSVNVTRTQLGLASEYNFEVTYYSIDTSNDNYLVLNEKPRNVGSYAYRVKVYGFDLLKEYVSNYVRFEIETKKLNLNLNNIAKVYDGTETLTLLLTNEDGIVNNEVVNLILDCTFNTGTSTKGVKAIEVGIYDNIYSLNYILTSPNYELSSTSNILKMQNSNITLEITTPIVVDPTLIQVGTKTYTTEELYQELLSSEKGREKVMELLNRMVIEESIETTSTMIAAAELSIENLLSQAHTNSLVNGTTIEEETKILLELQGCETIEEYKSNIIYDIKMNVASSNYWQESIDENYNDFIEERLPYLVRHVLVKIDDSNGNKISNNASISSSDAKKLYDVIKRFEAGDKFSYVANQESEDTGSSAIGGAYYMDNTYGVVGFVDEFVYGTYLFDAYTTKQVSNGKTIYVYGTSDRLKKLNGLIDVDTINKYYQNGFNFVHMDIVNVLEKVYNQTSYSDKDYFQISAVNKILGENDEVRYQTASGNINSTENYYARSIIFNRAFNKPGVSVIGYNSEQEAIDAGAKNYVELKLSDTESKFILTDEKGNPIFFVVARGSNNQLWVHFLTINVSTLNDLDDAKKFFSLNPDASDNYTSYAELMNTTGTYSGMQKYIEELEGYLKSYLTNGIGSSSNNENILKYDMFKYLKEKNSISINDEYLNQYINDFIANQKAYSKKILNNSLEEDWYNHTNKLELHLSEYNQMGIKPFECGVYAGDVASEDNPYTALTTSDYLCRYVYGEGYEVQLSYYYKNSSTNDAYTKISTNQSNRAYFNDNSEYIQWVAIGSDGSEHFVLPTPIVDYTRYRFEGWYTDKKLTNEVSKDSSGTYYIDLSESRITNKTIFFAKIVEISQGEG